MCLSFLIEAELAQEKKKQTPNWYIFFKYWEATRTAFRFFLKFSSFLTFILAKTLVASLMEVDQDQRLTAQEAIAHEW